MNGRISVRFFVKARCGEANKPLECSARTIRLPRSESRNSNLHSGFTVIYARTPIDSMVDGDTDGRGALSLWFVAG
jgi:hypothetical protein